MCKKEKTIADIFDTLSDNKKDLIFSIIANDKEKLSAEEFLEKYKDYI